MSVIRRRLNNIRNYHAYFDGTTNARYNSYEWNGGPITVEFWNYVASPVSNGTFAFGTPDFESTTIRASCSAPHGSGTLYWDYGNYGGAGRISADYSTYLDKWTHIALASGGINGSWKAIYFDGALAASSTAASDGPVGTSLNIGSLIGGSNFHIGNIDEFRIWDHVRSLEQIQENKDKRILPQSGLLFHIPFDTNFKDQSGNNNILTSADAVRELSDNPNLVY